MDEQGYSKIVDFWSLGVLLFEMCCGWSPFYAEDTQQMYKNICYGKIRFPKGVINDDGKQFVKGVCPPVYSPVDPKTNPSPFSSSSTETPSTDSVPNATQRNSRNIRFSRILTGKHSR